MLKEIKPYINWLKSVFHHNSVCMKSSYIPKFKQLYFLRILKKNNHKVKKCAIPNKLHHMKSFDESFWNKAPLLAARQTQDN